ncbi:MAG TPA: tetratricopeptide repeat protein [Bryobacteraceae bacterium]|jgi:tetratricopeptide (TPR) repeat protein|nr:tetratricopeptide repeat protein [Bryobacteraceae bacterium]
MWNRVVVGRPGSLAGCLRHALVLLLLTASCALAQTSTKEQFEDLSRRAQAVLDSHPQNAIQLYKQALDLRPDWPEGWLYMGGALYQLGRYAEATDALRKGIGLAPVFANGWALLGLSESQLDDPDQALADIRKGEGLGLGGNLQFETAVRVRAAQLLIRSSAFDEALAQLQPLAKNPNNPPPVEEAMGLCTLASPDDMAQLSPERRAVVDLAGKAAWEFASLHPDAAAAAYRKLLAQYPNAPGVHYAYGLYLMQTDAKAALAELQKEVQNNPKHWPALLVIASIQIRQGTPEQAVETLRAAMKLAPAKYRWLCHTNLGRADLDANNVSAAITELEDAVRQMPSSASAHFFLAEAYRQAARTADAEREKAEFEKMKAQQDPLGVPALHPFGISGKN